METVEDNQVEVTVDKQEELEVLRQEARDLGIEFRNNIGHDRLNEKIETKLNELAEKQKAKKAKKNGIANLPKVKIVIESRDDDNIPDQFFAINSMATGHKENIQIQFGEEVEISQLMYEHIKAKGGYIKKFRMITDSDGMPKKEWYNKWQSRFIVSKID